MYPHHHLHTHRAPSSTLIGSESVAFLVPLKRWKSLSDGQTTFTLKVCSFRDNDNRGGGNIEANCSSTKNNQFMIFDRSSSIGNLSSRLPTEIYRIVHNARFTLWTSVTALVNGSAYFTGRSAVIYIIISAYNQCIQLVLITLLRSWRSP